MVSNYDHILRCWQHRTFGPSSNTSACCQPQDKTFKVLSVYKLLVSKLYQSAHIKHIKLLVY